MSDKKAGEINRSLAWKICLYLTLVYLGFGLLCFSVWMRSDVFSWIGFSWSNPQAETFQRIMYALCAGAFGGISYTLWQFFEHYCRAKDFQSNWIVWYVFGPINGSLLGIATYAVIVGGLLVLGTNVNLRSNWALFALAFLAGFGSKRVLRKLHAIAGEIFEKTNTIESTE